MNERQTYMMTVREDDDVDNNMHVSHVSHFHEQRLQPLAGGCPLQWRRMVIVQLAGTITALRQAKTPSVLVE